MITTELLNGSERANVYDRDLTMDYLIEKYFERIKVNLNYSVKNISSSQELLINATDVIKEYLNPNNEFNTFVKSSESFTDINVNVGYSVKSDIDLNVKLNSLETEDNMWYGISETSLYFEDVNGEREFTETVNRFVYKTISGTPKKYEEIYYTPVKGYRVGDYLERFTVKRQASPNTPDQDPTTWTNLNTNVSFTHTRFNPNIFRRPANNGLGMPFYYMDFTTESKLNGKISGKYLVLPSYYCIGLSELGLSLDVQGFLNNIYIVFEESFFEDYCSFFTNFDISNWISEFKIRLKSSFNENWNKTWSVDARYTDCLNVTKKDFQNIYETVYNENYVETDFDTMIEGILNCASFNNCKEQVESWRDHPVYRERDSRGEIIGVYQYKEIGSELCKNLISELTKALINCTHNNVDWDLGDTNLSDFETGEVIVDFWILDITTQGPISVYSPRVALRQIGRFSDYINNETLS